MKKIYIYKAFERFWHWMQAALIIILIITGFEIHSSFEFFGYENAVNYHSSSAVIFIILIIFSIFWHFATGEWKQYIPTTKNLKEQIEYYLIGIFKNAQHPVEKHELSKLNPLQRLTYLGLKLLIFPVMVGSGLLYLYYRYPQQGGIHILDIGGLKVVALLHTASAFLLVAFLIAHLYLITTGQTITSNLKAMITGWEEK
ncbi:MAG: cytochrome b/b6 domain-containing protein [Candidatus Hatepunaea meridiana]|nr:cytochrome b/b6 domain-containing protein [Candidatus Hatepunaea meridiana]